MRKYTARIKNRQAKNSMIMSKKRGQFAPVKWGQFAPQNWGLFGPVKWGLFGRNFHTEGAPRKFNSILNGMGYSHRNIADVILSLLALKKNEIETICKSEECSILERTVAHTLLNDLAKGKFVCIDTILKYHYGASKNKISKLKNSNIELVIVKSGSIDQ